MSKIYDLIVVGAGAAGLMCAGTAAKRGLDVLLLEKNKRVGRKLLITGKGRCNITNDCDNDAFLAAVRNNSRFMYSAINAFSTADTMEFFETNGVPLKTERGSRVFPQSDKAMDVVDCMDKFVRKNGVHVAEGTAAQLICENGAVTGIKTVDGTVFMGKNIMISTGGLSYPLTGSTGDGYKLAQSVGHTIVPTQPSLVPIVTSEKWCADVMGLSLKNVTLTVLQKGKKKPVYKELGEMLFTHFGVSGPLVLSASSHMQGSLSEYKLEIDMKPGLTEQQLDARLLRDFEKFSNRDFANALDELLPRKLIPIVIKLSNIPASQKVNQVSKEQRAALIAVLKALPLNPKAFRPVDEAIVTAGGVKTSEVSPKTMESKLIKGLYFAGEVLDLDGYTGGYNLQIAFSTGYLAAMSME